MQVYSKNLSLNWISAVISYDDKGGFYKKYFYFFIFNKLSYVFRLSWKEFDLKNLWKQ